MDPVTPPAAVRAAALFSYGYSWFLGVMALATQSPVYAKGALLTLTTVYLADAALAACPLKWCNMRGIPPASILKHHLPFAIALFPNLILVVFYDDEFTEVRRPVFFERIRIHSFQKKGYSGTQIHHYGHRGGEHDVGERGALGRLVVLHARHAAKQDVQSRPETLVRGRPLRGFSFFLFFSFLFFSFFYKNKKNDLLAQVIFITGWSSARTLLEFYPFVFVERVRTALYFTSLAFFFIVPLVQVSSFSFLLSLYFF